MEKPNRIPQVYGYAVCLVTVITFLICATDFVNAFIDKGDPFHTNSFGKDASNLASFEIYKMDLLKTTKGDADPSKVSLPDDKTLREMYQTAKDEKIRSEMHRINKSLAVDSILIILCILLFTTHWRWMRSAVTAA